MEKKICTKCGEEKTLEEFDRQKSNKTTGRRAACKFCRKAIGKEYREANKNKLKERSKIYYINNKDKIKAYKVEYYNKEENKSRKKNTDKQWRENNKDRVSTNKKKYYANNKDKVKHKVKEWRRNEYAKNPVFRTINSLRAQTQRLGKYKNESTINLIGCSSKEFWQRNGSPSIEQLKDLQIDHIVPLSWFNLENEDHLKVSSHWTNLQYLNAEDNLNKSDNYAGRPNSILGYRDEFNIDKHVKDMIEFINSI